MRLGVVTTALIERGLEYRRDKPEAILSRRRGHEATGYYRVTCLVSPAS
jgi:hypothetical protein